MQDKRGQTGIELQEMEQEHSLIYNKWRVQDIGDHSGAQRMHASNWRPYGKQRVCINAKTLKQTKHEYQIRRQGLLEKERPV